MKYRVLVTGSTGYIGKNLTRRLQGLPDITVYGLNRSPDANLPPEACLQGDLLETDLSGWLAEIRPDAVFHCIGADRQSAFENQLKVNAEGTRRLLQALVDCALQPRVIVLGSAAEYGLRDDAVDEQSVCQPEGEYGIAKLAQTHIAQCFSRRGLLPVLVARVFNVYGHTDRHLAIASLAAQIAQAEARNTEQVELQAYNLRSWRDFVHIDDVVDALLSLWSMSMPANGALYNIASGHSTAMTSILETLLSYSELGPEPMKRVALNLNGPQREDISWADIGKIRQQTGWEPKITLAEGLRQELDYWRAQTKHRSAETCQRRMEISG